VNPGIVVSTGLLYLLLSTETVHILMGWVVLNDCTANFIEILRDHNRKGRMGATYYSSQKCPNAVFSN